MAGTAFVALGSNLSAPEQQILRAFAEIGTLPGTRRIACSSLYRSAPVGFEAQPDFINAVAQLETSLSARELLQELLALEHRHGRSREFHHAPRTLDLDLLLFDELQIHEPGLTLPHPRMHERAFVLLPLYEIAPGCAIPGRERVADLLAACADQKIEKMEGGMNAGRHAAG